MDELDELSERVDKLSRRNPADLPGPALADAAVAVVQLAQQIDALACGIFAAFDASGEHKADGQPTVAAWLAAKVRVAKGWVNKRVHLGRRLRSMPHTAEAFRSGAIGIDHVDVLAKANQPALADAFARDEPELVETACAKRFVPFCRDLRYWADINAPDDADERALAAFERRHGHASKTWEDMTRVDADLDPIGGSLYRTELDRLTAQLFEQDWAEARARLGDTATIADLRRTTPQRRADAMVLMALRSSQLDEPVRGPRIVLNVVIDYQTFCAELAKMEAEARDALEDALSYPAERICRLADGTILPPSLVLSLGLAGEVRRLVLGADSEVIDFGDKVRFFTGPVREAVQLAHDSCTWRDGCDIPAHLCEIDHIHAVTDGGPTDAANAQPHCKAHNRFKERIDARKRRRC